MLTTGVIRDTDCIWQAIDEDMTFLPQPIITPTTSAKYWALCRFELLKYGVIDSMIRQFFMEYVHDNAAVELDDYIEQIVRLHVLRKRLTCRLTALVKENLGIDYQDSVSFHVR
ncbi:hypothetical protein SPFM12_00296 [Salmonella phage SPFM12]|nr:hypothetical protein SPFM12_00296 [Salmonella phage SPFM12]